MKFFYFVIFSIGAFQLENSLANPIFFERQEVDNYADTIDPISYLGNEISAYNSYSPDLLPRQNTCANMFSVKIGSPCRPIL